MIKVSLRRKGLIGISMALVLCILGVGVHTIRAASAVDTDADVTITAEVDSTSALAMNYTGEITIDLYKIASMDVTGDVKTLEDGFKNSGINLSILKDNPTVAIVEESIVNKALAVVDGVTPTATITIDRSTGQSSGYVSIPKGAGLYLYVPSAEDRRYLYEFTSYVLFAPTSQYITPRDNYEADEGMALDEWKYDVDFGLKSNQVPKLGTLIIEKQLDDYNESLAAASFVYKVKAQIDEKVVFDDVVTIEFESARTQQIELEIPATATVTVEEVYTGASYELASNKVVNDIVIEAGGESTARFENRYDEDKMISGGISAVNTFVKRDGEYVHVGMDDIPQ